MIAAILLREVRLAWRGGGAGLPVAFFVLATALFAFAIGPDTALLGRVGGAVIWTAALLAALLPVERLVGPDLENGVVDQLLVRGVSPALLAAVKLAAHWLGFAPPLMLAAVIAAGLLGVPAPLLARIELGLLIGTPGLAALAVATGALVAGLRGVGALAGLLMLPLAVPVLIFGTGMLAPSGAGALQLLAATSLALVAGAPFVAGAAIRFGSD